MSINKNGLLEPAADDLSKDFALSFKINYVFQTPLAEFRTVGKSEELTRTIEVMTGNSGLPDVR